MFSFNGFTRNDGLGSRRINMTAGKPSLLEAFAASALQCSQCKSLPVPHLLWEWALRAIGIVLHAKVFVDLEQPLLLSDRA